MNYSYERIKWYCEFLGLKYYGDDYMAGFAKAAADSALTQEQFDAAVYNALWHVRTLFTPQTYTRRMRFALALHFLFGKMPPLKGA